LAKGEGNSNESQANGKEGAEEFCGHGRGIK
jgi:hypothetical protein